MKKTIILLVLATLLLSGCAKPTAEATPTPSATSVPPSETPKPSPTLRPTGTATPEPTATLVPTPTATPLPLTCEGDQVKFQADITVPDGTTFQAGEAFTKTWGVINAGLCTWDERYTLRFIEGEQMGGTPVTNLSAPVAPNETLSLTVSLNAPLLPGAYTGRWGLFDPSEAMLGGTIPLTLTVIINVVERAAGLLPQSLYYINDQDGQVWRVESDGQTQTQITFADADVTEFEISPVTGNLAYVSGGALWLANAAGGEARLLIETGASNPLWSPDGRRLAYQFEGLKTFSTVNGAGVALVALEEGDSCVPLAWSPNGSQLVAECVTPPLECPYNVLFTSTTLSGENYRRSLYGGSVVWNREGGLVYIARNSGCSGGPRLGIATAPGGSEFVLLESPEDTFAIQTPFIAQDGSMLGFYAASSNDLLTLSTFGILQVGKEVTATALREESYRISEALWMLDGSGVLVREESGQVWLLLLDGSEALSIELSGVNLRWGP
ncbi:MAG: PD40 domain-containing protein [Anaerolineales bacterium]|nr:PD40 domain-containing protein [Anaerolineales bacterium]